MMDLQWYTSIAGVVTVTIILVNLLKKALSTTEFWGTLPTWLYAVVVAVGLTEFCHFVLGTIEGAQVDLVTQAVVYAALASGFREWGYNFSKPLQQSTQAQQTLGDIERGVATGVGAFFAKAFSKGGGK